MRKVALFFVTIFTVINLLFAVTVNIQATSNCKAANGATCSGECCKAGADYCIGGPCDIVLKL